MANTIKILFWLRRTKVNKQNLVPLMIRLSYQNTKLDKATSYYISPFLWNCSKQRLRGNQIELTQINSWLDSTVIKVATAYKEGLDSNNLHLATIMNKLFAATKEEPTLLKIMLEHNGKLKSRVKKDYSHSTYEKYVFTYNKVKAFIETSLISTGYTSCAFF